MVPRSRFQFLGGARQALAVDSMGGWVHLFWVCIGLYACCGSVRGIFVFNPKRKRGLIGKLGFLASTGSEFIIVGHKSVMVMVSLSAGSVDGS